MTDESIVKEVRNYALCRVDGSRIRTATLVELASGRVIRFMEKMTKRDAIRNALNQVAIEY
jgi:hypothetical protein